MRIIITDKPRGMAARTKARSFDPGITYNQTGVSYNDSRYSYGGQYGTDEVQPSVVFIKIDKPSSFALQTNQRMFDPGITYNQAGVVYNDARYDFGGLYGFNEVLPLVSFATGEKPRIVFSGDIYTTQGTAPIGNNQSLAPGFFLYITH